MYSIGIDIGGTKIAGALVDANGVIARETKVKSPIDDSEKMVNAIVGLIEELSTGEQVLGVGVAAAGFLSADREILYHAPNISSWRNEPLKSRISERIKFPVLLENDANAAGWAEFEFGAARKYSSMVMLTIGTGVGGGIVTNGQLLTGGFGIAGELGHALLVPDGKVCGCGLKGCLEVYASGTALLLAAKELAATDPNGRLAQLKKERGGLHGEEVYQAITEGDPGAVRLIRDLGHHLGRAIGQIFVPVLDPEVVVIGGGVSNLDNILLDPIRETYLAAYPGKGFRPELEIVKAHFLNQAGLIGAADLARKRFG